MEQVKTSVALRNVSLTVDRRENVEGNNWEPQPLQWAAPSSSSVSISSSTYSQSSGSSDVSPIRVGVENPADCDYPSVMNLEAPLACSTQILDNNGTCPRLNIYRGENSSCGETTRKSFRQKLNRAENAILRAINNLSIFHQTSNNEHQQNASVSSTTAENGDIEAPLRQGEEDEEGGRELLNDLTHTVTDFSEFYTFSELNDTFVAPEITTTYPEVRPTKLEEEMGRLTKECLKQEEIMSQAMKAIETCLNSKEFMGSIEQVEAEKAYLVANIRQKVLKAELARIYEEIEEEKNLGTVKISNLIFHTRESTQNLGKASKKQYKKEYTEYFVCVAVCDTEVRATEVTIKTSANTINFPEMNLIFEKLPTHFEIVLKLYVIKVKNNLRNMSYESKYHLNNKDGGSSATSFFTSFTRDFSRKSFSSSCSGNGGTSGSSGTSRTLSHHNLSYALGSYDVWASLHLTIGDLKKSKIGQNYNVMIFNDALTKRVEMNISGKVNIQENHGGFINLGYELSGAIVWERRWCELNSEKINLFKSPLQQPMEEIDLTYCVTSCVGKADRELCPRPRCLMLELVRRPIEEPNRRRSSRLIERYFMQCDTLKELHHWQKKINSVICTLRNWDNMQFNLQKQPQHNINAS